MYMSWKESTSHWIDPEEEEENGRQVPFGVPEFIYNVPDNPPQELPLDMWYRANKNPAPYGSGWYNINTLRDPIWLNRYGSTTRENQLKNYPENLIYGVKGKTRNYRPTNVQDMEMVRAIAEDMERESLYNQFKRILGEGYVD